MSYEEAKAVAKQGKRVYRASYEASDYLCNIGRGFSETIGYFRTKAEALKEARFYKANCGEPRGHIEITRCDDCEFDD